MSSPHPIGTTLRDLLRQVGTLPPSRAVAITIDITRALEAMHNRGIVRHDVQPANIIISPRGVATLTDFGIASVPGAPQPAAMMGSHPTPAYMSPEQATNFGSIDGRSDLYSLGLVLYEMLVGESFARQQQPLRTLRPDVPPKLIAVVEKLMAPAAYARHQIATELLLDLQAHDLLEAGLSQQPTARGQMPAVPPSPPVWSSAPPGNPTPGGLPAAYGGIPSLGSTSAPPGIPTGAPPGVITSLQPPPGSTSGPAPPGYGGMTSNPYGGPPPQPTSNRGALFGIIGAVVVLAAVVVGALVFTHRGPDPPATATPNVGAATLTTVRVTSIANTTTAPIATADSGVTLVTPTRAPTIPITAPTATLAVTITPTPPATTPTSGSIALTDTWTDTDGLISMKFPGDWTRTRDNTDPSNLVEFTPSNGPVVDIYLDDPQQGTLADEVVIITRNQANSQKYTYTNQPTQDLTIAGEPAKVITFTYTDKSDATKSFLGAYWVINHNGRQYSIAASPIGSFRPTLDAMVASATFPTAKVTTWIDSDKALRTRYPKDWNASSDADNALILNGANDGVHIFVSILNPGSKTIDQEFKSIRDGGSDDGKTIRTYDPVTDTKVGGQPAKSMAYKYAPKTSPSATSGTATIWIVDYKGKRFEFFCSNMTVHRQEIETFMNTVAFLK